MTWMWFSGAWNRLRASFRPGRPARPPEHRRARLRVEALESRIVPAFTDIWTGAANDGNWFNDSNWSAGHVPTSDDTVEIPTGIAVIPGGGQSFAQADSVTVDGGVLDVEGFLDTGSFFQIAGLTGVQSGGQIFANRGFSETGGEVAITGGLIHSSGIDLTGGTMVGFGTLRPGLEVGGTVTNDGGVLDVEDAFFIEGNYAQTAAGTLLIAPITSSAPGSAPCRSRATPAWTDRSALSSRRARSIPTRS